MCDHQLFFFHQLQSIASYSLENTLLNNYILKLSWTRFTAPQAHTHTRTHTRTYTHSHAHAHTCTHTHTLQLTLRMANHLETHSLSFMPLLATYLFAILNSYFLQLFAINFELCRCIFLRLQHPCVEGFSFVNQSLE